MRSEIYKTFWSQLDTVLRSNGKLALPNVKEITDPQKALNLINSASQSLKSDVKVYNFRVQNFDPPIKFEPPRMGHQTNEITYYPKFFLNSLGMGDSFDGSGVFVCIPSGRGQQARAFTFYMCEHEWDESGANHSRGWHPAVCKKCGFDASIDSGD